MKIRSWKVVLGVLLLLLAFFLFFSNTFFLSKLSFTSSLNGFPGSLSGTNNLENRIAELEKENKNLKFQLLNEKLKKPGSVKVYSAYPFNNRGEVAIAAGANLGIKVGDVITYGDNILVGKVTKVFESYSTLITIFDPSWKISVRVGEHEVDALMQGGNELTITLIPQEAEIRDGDLVITASGEFPYGLGVGVLKNIKSAPGNAFKEAILEPSFQLKQLKDVSIYR